MNANSLDHFMTKEYDIIAEAFFSLHTQKNQMLRYYLTIIAIGTTGISLASQAVPKMFEYEISVASTIRLFGLLLLILALVGVIVFNSIIGIRADMILYARTVNRIRGYFVNKDLSIVKFLVLPYSDEEPKFRESFLQYFFYEVTLLGFLNGIMLTISVTSITLPTEIITLIQNPSFATSSIFVICILALTLTHVGLYFLISKEREDRWKEERGYLKLNVKTNMQ